jgi:hypothetical protein
MGSSPDTALWGAAAVRSAEVQQLAARIVVCEDRAAAVLAGFWEVQLSQWQSPAGRAYRDRVGAEAVAMRRALERLAEAAAAVSGHARAALTAGCSFGGSH